MNITIRQATVKDFAVIQKFNADLFTSDSVNDDTLDLNWPYGPAGVRYYKKSFEDPEKIVLIAENEKDKAVGYLIGCARNKFNYRTVKTGELENMYVTPSVRRKGIGTLLVNGLTRWLRQNGIDRMYISAFIGNTNAIAFYTKVGFSPWETGMETKL